MMLKKYQVAESQDDMWFVYKVYDQRDLSGFSYAAEIHSIGQKFETAAEAQELADQLNEQEQDK